MPVRYNNKFYFAPSTIGGGGAAIRRVLPTDIFGT